MIGESLEDLDPVVFRLKSLCNIVIGQPICTMTIDWNKLGDRELGYLPNDFDPVLE